jgi:hypothetical protein
MGSPARQIESEAMELSPRERARLAERLVSSIGDEADPGVEAMWARDRNAAGARLSMVELMTWGPSK